MTTEYESNQSLLFILVRSFLTWGRYGFDRGSLSLSCESRGRPRKNVQANNWQTKQQPSFRCLITVDSCSSLHRPCGRVRDSL